MLNRSIGGWVRSGIRLYYLYQQTIERAIDAGRHDAEEENRMLTIFQKSDAEITEQVVQELR